MVRPRSPSSCGSTTSPSSRPGSRYWTTRRPSWDGRASPSPTDYSASCRNSAATRGMSVGSFEARRNLSSRSPRRHATSTWARSWRTTSGRGSSSTWSGRSIRTNCSGSIRRTVSLFQGPSIKMDFTARPSSLAWGLTRPPSSRETAAAVPSLLGWRPGGSERTTRMATSPDDAELTDDLEPEYDFRKLRGVVRGKYAERYQERLRVVRLAPDVSAAFADEDAVNSA